MPGFARRPITHFVCCLFAAIPVSVAAVDSDTLPDQAVKLRTERKFNVLGKTGTGAAKSASAETIGINNPVALKKGDSYPTFVIADQIEGRTNEEAVATGRVALRKIDTQMFADKITYWPLEDEVEAVGKVRLLQDGLEFDTAYLRMRMTEQIGFSGELDYRMRKLVESKFYQATGVVPVAATSNTSVSSAPMMANVANSYGLPTVQPGRRATEGNGHAERVDFEGENHIRLKDATYSTCKPDDMAWYLKGSQVHLDYDEDVGEARHASVWFLDVPIFYSPVASFPLNQQRKSGFLHASFGTTTNTGLDYTIPYYWNIAPNYDVTFNPRYMSKRGIQLGANINYLDYNYSGRTRLEYMPDDKIAGRDRYGYNIQHQHNFGRGVSGLINWNGVSDDAYWEDLSSKLLETSQVQIPQQLQLAYAPSPWLQTTMMVQRYQTLQTDAANPVERPYFLEPQLNILGFRPNLMKTDLALIGQFTRFTNPEKIQADRAVLYPQISLPIVHPAFQVTPKIGLHMTQYALSDVENFALNGMSAAPPDSISRTLPVLSLDSTVIFERESKFFDLGYIQTLEPRLYYVNIPYKDQQQIPVFDSGLTDFNFAQIFSENRYSGFDRINDANQLTAAVTTRFLDADTGVERFKAMLGQRYYFSDQRVTLPGETRRNTNLSNLIAAFNGLVLPKTYADAAIEYDYDLQEVDRFSVGARFQPDFGKVISASYRYTRDPLSLVPQVDQIDVSAQWPLSARWYAVGRYNYSLRDSQPLEAIAGLEYNAGCWAVRSVVQRLSAVSSTIEPNTSFFLQLELNDLGSIGSNPISLLRRTIPGYGKINELPNSGSLATTP